MSNSNKDLPHSLKLVTIWLLVMLAVFLGIKGLEHSRQQSSIELHQGRILLKRAPDGHFHWRGQVNGVTVDFLVDTGATSTALPQALAERAGLTPESQVRSHTAGGVVQGYRARADIALQGGVSAQRLPVTVLPDLGAPLLGMDLLSRLRFVQQDGVLSIEAP